MTTCTLCNRPSVAASLCAMHYQRQRRHGDPQQVNKAGRPRTETPATRLAARIPEDKLHIEALKKKNAELVKEVEGLKALPLKHQERLNKAIAKEHARLLADFWVQINAKVAEQLAEKVTPERERYNAMWEKCRDEKWHYEKLIGGVTALITSEDFRAVLVCLHPDQPDRSIAKLTKAFAIFKKLQPLVKTHGHMAIHKLREQGWAHVSPFYKPKKKPTP